MNIIVTGGAGFIGSNFIFHMLKKYPDYRIICLDKLTYAGNLSTLEPVMGNPNFRFVKADICDRAAVNKLFEEEEPDIVVNFAAESHVDRSIEDPGIFLQTNIMGTATLMDACRKYGIKRYHQVSTDEVYGDLPLDRPDLFFTEETPIHTSSPYSSSKAGADLLVMAYHRTYGLPVTISRCSNNYGPYHFPEKLIPLMIANALADKPLPVYGEGLNVRDWLYVEDHCKAIDLIIHKGRVGEVYNIGGHNEMRNIDIVKLICKELGKPESLITHVTDRKGHDMRYAIDPTKIHNELGWLPETKFADGIKKTIKWYLENQKWWKDIINGEYQKYYAKMYGNRGKIVMIPLVSVIVPIYNSEEFITETIESIINQSYKNLEIILINDGSTDNSKQICRKYLAKDSRIIYIEKENGGVVAARNDGIAKATGEYILPVDSDDIIEKTYIEKAVDIITKNDKIGIVYCKAEFIGAKTGYWDLPEFTIANILKDNCIFATALFKRTDWIKVGGYKEYVKNSTEDYDFWLSLIENGSKVYRIPEILFKYRIRENSRSTKAQYDKAAIIKFHKQLYQDNFRLLERGDLKKYIKNELNEKITIKKRAKYILIYFALRIHLINRLPSNICL